MTTNISLENHVLTTEDNMFGRKVRQCFRLKQPTRCSSFSSLLLVV
jgi:hypothetical protein